MRRSLLLLTLVGAMLLATTGVVLAQQSNGQQQGTGQGQPPPPGSNVPVCPGPAGPDTARCHAVRHDFIKPTNTNNGGATTGGETTGGSSSTQGATPKKKGGATKAGADQSKPSPNATTPSGYGPADLISAYNLPSSPSSSTPPTVAIVDAYDNPNAESDLNTYRSQFGLGPCTSSNGCFKKVNQKGIAGSYPRNDTGWAQEISLDIEMVSAICPTCKILLVEANSNSFSDLGTAVNTAANLGAKAISNSYGGSEWSGEGSYQTNYYNHPGIAITASSGDSGYRVETPAAFSTVVAVGGTNLVRSTDPTNARRWNETVWSGAGSGCSSYTSKPYWQTDSGCSKRTVADVSAVADPNTGVAVYAPANRKASSWQVYGGTSVAAPIIAAVYALAGHYDISSPYNNTGSLFDIKSGSNGSCGGSYLCTALSSGGYDGPTGLGTPNGIGAF